MFVQVVQLATRLPQYTIEELWEKPKAILDAWTSAIQVLDGNAYTNLRLSKEDKKAIEFLEENKEMMQDMWNGDHGRKEI